MRQVSEANNQASNGKTERMYRTVLNMARSMIFAIGLPLFFWGDAVQYATYVFNRSPRSASTKRMSPLEVLPGEIPRIYDIVVLKTRALSISTLERDLGNHGRRSA